MNIYSYSPSTGGFYLEGVHPHIPIDAVNVTKEHYETLMGELAQGRIIVAGEDGMVEAVAPPQPHSSPLPLLPDLTARQFWQAALVLGITEDGLIAAISDSHDALYIADEAERLSAIVDMRKASVFKRDYPLIDAMAAAHGLPQDQMDDLWLWAAQIE